MSEQNSRQRQDVASIEKRVAATKAALIEAGRIAEADLQHFVHMAEDWKPENGAKVAKLMGKLVQITFADGVGRPGHLSNVARARPRSPARFGIPTQ